MSEISTLFYVPYLVREMPHMVREVRAACAGCAADAAQWQARPPPTPDHHPRVHRRSVSDHRLTPAAPPSDPGRTSPGPGRTTVGPPPHTHRTPTGCVALGKSRW